MHCKYKEALKVVLGNFDQFEWGEQYLMGEKLKAVKAEFPAISEAVLLCNKENAVHAYGHF